MIKNQNATIIEIQFFIKYDQIIFENTFKSIVANVFFMQFLFETQFIVTFKFDLFVVIENFFVNKSSDIFEFDFFVVIEKSFVNKSIDTFEFKTLFVDKKFLKTSFFQNDVKLLVFLYQKRKTTKHFKKTLKKCNWFDNLLILWFFDEKLKKKTIYAKKSQCLM